VDKQDDTEFKADDMDSLILSLGIPVAMGILICIFLLLERVSIAGGW
jgi:hypothetical protein